MKSSRDFAHKIALRRAAAMVFAAALSYPTACPSTAAQESKLDVCRDASRTAPADPVAALALGRALRRAGHMPEALAELRRGVAIAGSRLDVAARLHWEAARTYGDRHDLPHAMASCKALERPRGSGPETVATAESHACAAMAYLGWQRATESLSEAAAALAKDPANYDARVAEGRAHDLELNASAAEASLRAATALRPTGIDGEEAHAALGRVLWREGQKDEGIAELRRALQLDPSDPDALFELGSALLPSSESQGLFERATHERPSFTEAWLALGSLQLAAGALGLATNSAEAALKSDSVNVGALVLSGKVALATGRTDDALHAGRAALKIVPNNASAVLLVADANARKGEIDAALEAYQTAWGLDHADPAPLVHASLACHAASRDTSARAFGAKAVQEFPNYAPGWAALGDALAAEKDMKAARDAYRKALGLSDGVIDRASIAQKLAALQ